MNIDQYIHFRNYKTKQLLFITAILAILSYGILWLTGYLKTASLLPNYIVESPEQIIVVAFFYILILSFILLESFWRWLESLGKRNKKYKFRSQEWPIGWIFNGAPEAISISDLFVKSSRAGCLLENYMWKNFKMTFELKFPDPFLKHIGIIFRAIDLDNYFMLEILQNSPHHGSLLTGNRSGIKPHVRYRGGWEIMYFEEKKDFNFSEFVEIALEVKENTCYLYYKNTLIFGWILPTNVDINHIEAGIKQNNNTETLEKGVEKTVHEIPFRLNHGMTGFRAHPGQGAIIRGLKIEPL